MSTRQEYLDTCSPENTAMGNWFGEICYLVDCLYTYLSGAFQTSISGISTNVGGVNTKLGSTNTVLGTLNTTLVAMNQILTDIKDKMP